MNYLKKIGVLLAIGLLSAPMLLGSPSVQAQDIDSKLGDVGGSAGYDSGTDLEDTLGSLISVFLSILGIILLVLILYAGFLWMTAGGKEDQVKKAKTIMINAVIGLVILLAAYAISTFVIEALGDAGIAD